jgi:hypothetical protein
MKTCNLLPSKVQRQQLLAARLCQWLAVAAAAVVFTLVWFTLAWQKRAVEQRDADELVRQSRFVTYLSEQVEGLESKTARWPIAKLCSKNWSRGCVLSASWASLASARNRAAA